MSNSRPLRNRRRFFFLALATPLALAGRRDAVAQGVLDPNDRQAQALGYVEAAADADIARFARYEPGQTCANCTHFRPAEDGRGNCPIFGNRLVIAGGWCSAWASAG